MKYKLTILSSTPTASREWSFESRLELDAARKSCADLLLFLQDEAKLMQDNSNVFLIAEIYNDGWIALED